MKNRDNFEDVVWMDESMIQLENHRTFFTKGWYCSKAKTKGEASLQSDGVGGYLAQGSDKHLSLERVSK